MRLRTVRTIKTNYELAERHGWSAAPGCKVFVADRGAVRFDYPRTWIVRPTNDGIKFYDRKPPKDNLMLGISYLRDVILASLELDEPIPDPSRGPVRM